MIAIISIFFAAVIVGILMVPFWGPFVWSRISAALGSSPQDALIDVIADVVSKDYDSWHRDQFRLTHKSLGFSIWIGNDEYGIGLNTNKKDAWPRNDSRNNISLTSGQKYKLWRAIKNPMKARSKKHQHKFAAEIIERVIRHYETVQQPKATYVQPPRLHHGRQLFTSEAPHD